MNAKEAKEQTDKFQNIVTGGVRTMWLRDIEDATTMGRYSLLTSKLERQPSELSDMLAPNALRWLQGLGYTVTKKQSLFGNVFTVSWEDPAE